MLEAAQDALAFASRTSREGMEQDRMIAYAILHSIQIIGEASLKVSPETRASFPDIPWRDISDMQNRIVHAYQTINLDIVWSTIENDIPALAAALQAMLNEESGSEEEA